MVPILVAERGSMVLRISPTSPMSSVKLVLSNVIPVTLLGKEFIVSVNSCSAAYPEFDSDLHITVRGYVP